ECDLALPFRVEKIRPGSWAFAGRKDLGVLQNDKQMHIRADPKVIGIAELSGCRTFVVGCVRGEQPLVLLQQSPAHTPDNIAERRLALGSNAAKQHARAGLDAFDGDAGFLGEAVKNKAIEVTVVG